MIGYKEISERTGIPIDTLRHWKQRGKMPKEDQRVGYHGPLWREKTIEEWMDSNERPDQG